MARESLNIGPCPPDEEPVMMGSENYHVRSRQECKRYIRELRLRLGPEPEGAKLWIKTNHHDFGIYLEVECYYDPDIEGSVDYAFKCEGNDSPMNWMPETANTADYDKAMANRWPDKQVTDPVQQAADYLRDMGLTDDEIENSLPSE